MKNVIIKLIVIIVVCFGIGAFAGYNQRQFTNGDSLAYPVYDVHSGGHVIGGMTIREYFASQCMNKMLSRNGSYYSPQELAQRAVQEADALIAELNK